MEEMYKGMRYKLDATLTRAIEDTLAARMEAGPSRSSSVQSRRAETDEERTDHPFRISKAAPNTSTPAGLLPTNGSESWRRLKCSKHTSCAEQSMLNS